MKKNRKDLVSENLSAAPHFRVTPRRPMTWLQVPTRRRAYFLRMHCGLNQGSVRYISFKCIWNAGDTTLSATRTVTSSIPRSGSSSIDCLTSNQVLSLRN
jgi:hypothetical protein